MKVPSMKIGNGVASFRPLSLSCAGSISEQSSRASLQFIGQGQCVSFRLVSAYSGLLKSNIFFAS